MMAIMTRQAQTAASTRGDLNDSLDTLYRDASDRMHHQGIIDALAVKLDAPLPQVTRLYETRLRDLRADAVVTAFLPILIEKHVQAEIRRGREH